MTLSELLSYLARPPLYERTSEPFWNDPHISKGMLAAHLDPGTDAASRKPEFIDRSVEWISSMLSPGARLLDLGCGPGLYTRRFAERGFDVTGVDISERSIAYAREHDEETTYLVNDYLILSDVAAYDVIIMIWCDYGALVPHERQELLQRVHRALRPCGIFLIDVFTPAHLSDRTERHTWEVGESGGFWSPKSYLCLTSEYLYDNLIATDRYVLVQNSGIRTWTIWNTCFTLESLTAEAQPYGFDEAGFWGDVVGNPWTTDSTTLCAVLQKSLV